MGNAAGAAQGSDDALLKVAINASGERGGDRRLEWAEYARHKGDQTDKKEEREGVARFSRIRAFLEGPRDAADEQPHGDAAGNGKERAEEGSNGERDALRAIDARQKPQDGDRAGEGRRKRAAEGEHVLVDVEHAERGELARDLVACRAVHALERGVIQISARIVGQDDHVHIRVRPSGPPGV